MECEVVLDGVLMYLDSPADAWLRYRVPFIRCSTFLSWLRLGCWAGEAIYEVAQTPRFPARSVSPWSVKIERNARMGLDVESMRSARAAVALLLPLQKLEEDPFTLLLGKVRKCGAFALQESRELGGAHLRLSYVPHPKTP